MLIKTDASPAALWIGTAPTRGQFGAILTVALVGAVTLSLLPILLGGLLQEARLTAAQLGQAATGELLMMGVVSGLAGRHLRAIGGLAGGLLVIANLATTLASGEWVLATRALSGVGCGLYMWILVGMLVRAHNAARWVGIFTVLQAVTALALSSLYATVLVPQFGINGGFASLALLGGAVMLISRMLPVAYSKLRDPVSREGHVPPLPGLIAIFVPFFHLAGILAVWVYVGAISHQNGNDAAVTGFALSAAFAFQVVGGTTASLLGNRVPALPAIIVGAAISLVLAGVIAFGVSGALFIVCVIVFAGLWTFVIPYLLPFLVDMDPSLKAAMQIGSSQLFGCALGPAVASMTVRGADVRGALLAGAGLFALAIASAVAARVAVARGRGWRHSA